MNENLNAGIAFLAGIASFVSPCILPLIPAYLSLLGGTAARPQAARERWTAVVSTLFFVTGFTVVFVGLGVFLTGTFGLLGGVSAAINIIAGAIVMLLGINFIFEFAGFLNFERRFRPDGRPASPSGALLFGIAFGAGWTPCIGPILGSILLLAGSSRSVGQGAALLFVYSLGLGLPFVVTAMFLSPALRQLGKLKKHMRAIKIGSGVFLILIGLLILAGRLRGFNGFVFGAAARLDTWQKASPLASRLLFGVILSAIALLIALFAPIRARVASPRGSYFRPVRLVFFLLFAVAAVFTFLGVLNLPHLVVAWLNYQGM